MTRYAIPQTTIDGLPMRLGATVEVRLICTVEEPSPITGYPRLVVTDWAGPAEYVLTEEVAA